MELPIVFVMGLSGAGKSTLGQLVQDRFNFFHIEQDIPGENGIDKAGFRVEWDDYLEQRDAKSLVATLRTMALTHNKMGIILTFDSQVTFSIQDIDIAKSADIVIILLHGTDQDCLRSFLERESLFTKGYDAKHWHDYNDVSSRKLQDSIYDKFRINVFTNHKRVTDGTLIKEVKEMLHKHGY